MAGATFVLANASQDFITTLVGKSKPGSRVLDVVVSESRTLHARDWTLVATQVHADGGPDFTVELRQPTNARHLRIDVLHAGLDGLELLSAKHTPLDEATTRALLRSKTITFVGCARQCGAATDITLKRLAELGSLFGAWRAVVFENDSTDDTAERVRAFAAQHPVELIQQPGLKDLLPERTARLAHGRNRLLARALELGSDYICVADIDGLITADYPSEPAFLSNFALEPCWDAVFPVNAGMYYDVWALRHPVLCPKDYMTLGGVMDAALGQPLAVHFAASYVQIDLRHMQAWLPVDSAFGGMGLYKSDALREARYVGMQEMREVCEHVTLHAQLRAKGHRLFINPRFVVASHGGEGNPVSTGKFQA